MTTKKDKNLKANTLKKSKILKKDSMYASIKKETWTVLNFIPHILKQKKTLEYIPWNYDQYTQHRDSN